MMKKLILFMTAALIAGAANVGYAAARVGPPTYCDARSLEDCPDIDDTSLSNILWNHYFGDPCCRYSPYN